MKIFNEILETHTKVCTINKVYKVDENIDITVEQNENKVVMRGYNHKTDRFINFSTKKYKKLVDGFKAVSSDFYSDGRSFYYITLGENNSTVKADIDKDILIDKLQNEILELKAIINDLKLEIENNKVQKLKNERGAGRKNKFNENDIENIKMYRLQGKTIKEIAEIFNCSVGLIHKLINEK